MGKITVINTQVERLIFQLHPKTKTKLSLKKSPKTFQNNKN
jgi:hypothetical protein